jgi:hypothetical protein
MANTMASVKPIPTEGHEPTPIARAPSDRSVATLKLYISVVLVCLSIALASTSLAHSLCHTVTSRD